MDFLYIAAVPGAFIAGVLFHKYVVSEANKIKQHVTDEIHELRADFSEFAHKAAEKV